MVQKKSMRVCITGNESSFYRILVSNIVRWGYEAVIVSPEHIWNMETNIHTESDILLYDLDMVSRSSGSKQEAGKAEQKVGGVGSGTRIAPVWGKLPLLIALGSGSVSRVMLEELGAIAFLQKPFEMKQLQRYVQVLGRLIAPTESEQMGVRSCTDEIRVLVVDDDAFVAKTIRQSLEEKLGYNVVVAHEGLEALEVCLDWQPHCIITDVIMPWMNGYQIMRCLAAGTVQMMPSFIVMTALTQKVRPAESGYLPTKGVLYVQKPFRMGELLTMVEQACMQSSGASS
ncbi:response regulator receiver domain-containing protein [Thermosporothrix hazakensis]|jgi:CheY-like chemotaxis protein|uniref:Response regulator receiver domain-containing protein n=2 Tax=Thermosporothrix hazakensis TaxID=644383 RepID=A0A326U816_THEHA|nr:response regulator receiver domain-containing protein [Thermosporothrix hazakensis]